MIDYAPELVKGLKTVLPTYAELLSRASPTPKQTGATSTR